MTVIDDLIEAVVPSFRASDISIPEDLVEEIARIYGYHNLPSELPGVTTSSITQFGTNPYYWETRAKNAFKYWGFTEVYSYPMVSEEMYEGPTDEAVKLANPLGEEFVYMRRTLVPSLLKVMQDNKQSEEFQIFEIANVYEKDGKNLPKETRMLGGLSKTRIRTSLKSKDFLNNSRLSSALPTSDLRQQEAGWKLIFYSTKKQSAQSRFLMRISLILN